MEFGIISCVSQKRDSATRPRNLYVSDYFEKMRMYSETYHDDWRILSAKHGILHPDGPPIEPYDQTLRTATVEEKRDWAQRVVEQLRKEGFLQDTHLVIHAGQGYYTELLPLLEREPVTIDIPTESLRIGEKKAWYKEHL